MQRGRSNCGSAAPVVRPSKLPTEAIDVIVMGARVTVLNPALVEDKVMYKLSKLAAGSVIAATAAIGGAGVALADGYEPKGRVVYERPSDWSGVYFGVGSGYQWSSIDVSRDLVLGIDHRITMTRFVGAHIGLQHQFGNVVLGVEGDWMTSLRDKDGARRL